MSALKETSLASSSDKIKSNRSKKPDGKLNIYCPFVKLNKSSWLAGLTGVHHAPKAFIRRAEEDYKLTLDEDLSGPIKEYELAWGKIFTFKSCSKYHSYMINYIGSERKLSPNEKRIRIRIHNAIIDTWPNSDFDSEKAIGQRYSLTDACAFWFKVLGTVFRLEVTKWLNGHDPLVCYL